MLSVISPAGPDMLVSFSCVCVCVRACVRAWVGACVRARARSLHIYVKNGIV